MLIVVLVAIEIADSRLLARHHYVKAASVIRIRVRQAAENRELVHHLRRLWQDVTNLDSGNGRIDRFKVAADLGRSIRLQVPHILLRHSADQKQEDAVHVALRRFGRASLLQPQQLRKCQSANGADLKSLAAA